MGISGERNSGLTANWKVILVCACMSLANLQYGFDTTTIGGFQAMVGFLKVFGYRDPTASIGWNIDTQAQQLISSSLNIGTIIGVIFVGLFSRYFGRRIGIWLGVLINFVGAGVQLGTTSIGGLCAGRVLIGVANSFLFTLSNVYCVEATPAHLRALAGSFFSIWTTFGGLCGSIANQFSQEYKDKLSYQIPLAAQFVIPAILGVLLIFIPESPRWLLVQNRPEAAERALKKLRGNSIAPQFVREELTEMDKGIAEEKALASAASFWDMFKGTDLRRTVLVLGVMLSHTSSGLWVFLSYHVYFYQMAGIQDPFKVGVFSSIGVLFATFVGMFLMYKLLGRRPMMLIGQAATGLCMFGAALIWTIIPGTPAAARGVAAFSIMFSCFYTAFNGTISYPVAIEICSSRLRVLTVSLATGINYFFAWLTSFTTPYFLNSKALNWGAKYCWIWAASNAITFVFLYFMEPEVKGRTLEEIDELFQNRVSTRDFPKYECLSSTQAREIAAQESKLDDNEVKPTQSIPEKHESKATTVSV